MYGLGGQEILLLGLLAVLIVGDGAGYLIRPLLRLGRLAGKLAADSNRTQQPRPGRQKP